MNETVARKMMLGSEKQLDYLVVAARGDTVLGVKAFLSGSPKYGLLYAVRVRAAVPPSAPQPVQAKVHSGAFDWQELWPELIWSRFAKERASTVLMVPSGLQPWRYDMLCSQAPAAAEVAMDKLAEAIGLDHPKEDAAAFLAAAWVEEIKALEIVLPAVPEVQPEGPVAHYASELFETGIDADVSKPTDVYKEAVKPKPKFGVIEGGKGKGSSYSDADFETVD